MDECDRKREVAVELSDVLCTWAEHHHVMAKNHGAIPDLRRAYKAIAVAEGAGARALLQNIDLEAEMEALRKARAPLNVEQTAGILGAEVVPIALLKRQRDEALTDCVQLYGRIADLDAQLTDTHAECERLRRIMGYMENGNDLRHSCCLEYKQELEKYTAELESHIEELSGIVAELIIERDESTHDAVVALEPKP